MKEGLCLAVILLFSVCAYAHPGKTDRRGGHKCLRNCSEWELLYGEYHLHDKDWKPIRVNVKGAPIPDAPPLPDMTPSKEPQERAEPPEQTVVRSSGESTPETKIINQYRRVTMVREENILSLSDIVLIILAFLLLLALIFIRRKRDRD